MVKHYTNFNIQKIHKGSIILIGNFDGLHLGHQKLFRLAQSYKKKYNLKIGVVNFDSKDIVRHPLVRKIIDAYKRFES